MAARSRYADYAKSNAFPVTTFAAKYGIDNDSYLRAVIAGQQADEEMTVKIEAFVDWVMS